MTRDVNRRDFIKFMGIAGGLLLTSGYMLAHSRGDVRGIFDSIELSNGVNMPIFGFGTFKTSLGVSKYDEQKIVKAVDAGYRHIGVFDSTHLVGATVVSGKVLRNDVFISLFLDFNKREDDITAMFDEKLAELKIDYVDMVVLNISNFNDIEKDHILEAWEKIEKIYKNKKAMAVGISNLDSNNFDDFIYDCNVKPMLNYLAINPYNYDDSFVKRCYRHGMSIVVRDGFYGRPNVLNNEVILKIADKLEKTPRQILSRWNLQNGFALLRDLSDIQSFDDDSGLFDFALERREMRAISRLT